MLHDVNSEIPYTDLIRLELQATLQIKWMYCECSQVLIW